jgi:hypothetical protein
VGIKHTRRILVIIHVSDVQIAGMAFTSGHNIEHIWREGSAC